jgi:DNA polymerase-1
MTKPVFLAYSLNAFDENKAGFACADDSGRVKGVNWQEIARGTTVVTYNAATIVRYLHSTGNPLPQSLIGIGDALRLLSGVSRDDGGESKWALWPLIRPFFDSKSDFCLFVDVVEGIAAQPPGEDLTRLLVCAANGLREVWRSTLAALEGCGELDRFFQIEVPVQQVFWARQYNGLHIDRTKLSALLEKARGDKYSAFRELAAILNMSPTGLTVRTIGPLLQKTDARHLEEFSGQANFEDYLKVARVGLQ